MPLKPVTRSVCGLEELESYRESSVTHVLSLLDPGRDVGNSLSKFALTEHKVIHFHDIIEACPDYVLPQPEHISEILTFGQTALDSANDDLGYHVLVHCFMGVSRSTAAMITLMAQSHPEWSADELFAELRTMRPRAWPNSLIIAYADELLERQGTLNTALRRHYHLQLEKYPELGPWMVDLGRQREVHLASQQHGIRN